MVQRWRRRWHGPDAEVGQLLPEQEAVQPQFDVRLVEPVEVTDHLIDLTPCCVVLPASVLADDESHPGRGSKDCRYSGEDGCRVHTLLLGVYQSRNRAKAMLPMANDARAAAHW